MAEIKKQRVRLEIEWSKEDPSNFRYRAIGWGYVDDDSEPIGQKELTVIADYATIERSAFRASTGQQIENNAAALVNAALQGTGFGAGGHTIIDDDGD